MIIPRIKTHKTSIYDREIVIIEENLSVYVILKDFLNKIGYKRIHICENGATGIRTFSELVKMGNLPLVFLSDDLADMKSDDFIDQIFAIRPDARIILATAQEDADDSLKGIIRHGICDHVKKPIRFLDIKNVMETFEKEDVAIQHPEPATQEQLGELVPKKTTILSFDRKTTIAIAVITIGVIAFLGVSTYQGFFLTSLASQLMNEGYVIKNLKGDVVTTWVAWNIPDGQAIKVNIINSDLLTLDKMNIAKDVILSEENLDLENSLVGKVPPEITSTYYKGWRGALKEASNQNTLFSIPINFEIVEGSSSTDQIRIILSEEKSNNEIISFTRSIADETRHQLLRSEITIFGVKSLSDEQLATILRHEFGHALGLSHSTAPEDLMYETIETNYPYISECDIDAIRSLYNADGNKVTCNN